MSVFCIQELPPTLPGPGHQIPVASKRVLEQPSELGVPVGHVHHLLALVPQGADHIAQGQLWENESRVTQGRWQRAQHSGSWVGSETDLIN